MNITYLIRYGSKGRCYPELAERSNQVAAVRNVCWLDSSFLRNPTGRDKTAIPDYLVNVHQLRDITGIVQKLTRTRHSATH